MPHLLELFEYCLDLWVFICFRAQDSCRYAVAVCFSRRASCVFLEAAVKEWSIQQASFHALTDIGPERYASGALCARRGTPRLLVGSIAFANVCWYRLQGLGAGNCNPIACLFLSFAILFTPCFKKIWNRGIPLSKNSSCTRPTLKPSIGGLARLSRFNERSYKGGLPLDKLNHDL